MVPMLKPGARRAPVLTMALARVPVPRMRPRLAVTAEGPSVLPAAFSVAPLAITTLCVKLVARVTSSPLVLLSTTFRPTGTVAAHSPPAGKVKLAPAGAGVR